MPDYPQPSADPNIIWTVVISIAVLCFTGLCTLAAMGFLKISDPVIVTAIVTITSNFSGALTTLLASVKSLRKGSPSSDGAVETTSSSTTTQSSTESVTPPITKTAVFP